MPMRVFGWAEKRAQNMDSFLPVSISIKNVAASLVKGGLLASDYALDRGQANKFIKAAVSMGYHYDEAKQQVINDQLKLERNQDESKRKN
jgi:hypothetical protein